MEYEPFSIRLAEGVVYTPDFVVFDWPRVIVEVKEEWGNKEGGYRIRETRLRMLWAKQLLEPWGWVFRLMTFKRSGRGDVCLLRDREM